MLLTRLNPARFDAVPTLEEFRRSFEPLLGDFELRTQAVTPPRANVLESDEAYLISLEAPGISEKDLTITETDNVVEIRGRESSAEPEGYTMLRRERAPFDFQRTFTFATRIDAARAEATLVQGILTLKLPKHQDTRPRAIEVKTE